MTTNQDKVPAPASGCLLIPRFWEIALQLSCGTPEESEHLLTCRRCRDNLTRAIAAVHARESAERKFAAALLLLAALARSRARQPFALPRPADQFATGSAQENRSVYNFDDPSLRATVGCHPDGTFLLRVEHRELRPGTLVLVLVKTPDGSRPLWARFVMPRQGYSHAIGEVRLTPALEDRNNQLFIDPVTELLPESADLLRDSFLQACVDAPESVEAWQAWARDMLERGPADDALRRVLEEVRDSEPPAPPTEGQAEFATRW